MVKEYSSSKMTTRGSPSLRCLKIWILSSWGEGLHTSSCLRDFATTLGDLKWSLIKEGGCPMTEDISSAPCDETERASCKGVPPGPFSLLRRATQLATSNILQSKHVLTLRVGSNPEV